MTRVSKLLAERATVADQSSNIAKDMDAILAKASAESRDLNDDETKSFADDMYGSYYTFSDEEGPFDIDDEPNNRNNSGNRNRVPSEELSIPVFDVDDTTNYYDDDGSDVVTCSDISSLGGDDLNEFNDDNDDDNMGGEEGSWCNTTTTQMKI